MRSRILDLRRFTDVREGLGVKGFVAERPDDDGGRFWFRGLEGWRREDGLRLGCGVGLDRWAWWSGLMSIFGIFID